MAKGWYVVHTYTGYEQKIERTINKLRSIDGEFAAYCTGVSVPMEKVLVINDKGEKKEEMKKVLPGREDHGSNGIPHSRQDGKESSQAAYPERA